MTETTEFEPLSASKWSTEEMSTKILSNVSLSSSIKPNSVTFNLGNYEGQDYVLRISKDGIEYKGEKVDDPTEAMSLLNKVLVDLLKANGSVAEVNMHIGGMRLAIGAGSKVSRQSWPQNKWVCLVKGGYWGVSNAPYEVHGESHTQHADMLCIRTEDCKFVPWIPSQEDLLAMDYFIVKE